MKCINIVLHRTFSCTAERFSLLLNDTLYFKLVRQYYLEAL